MRTYALAAWLILCAGVRPASAWQSGDWGDDPFLGSGTVEQIGRLEDRFWEDARRSEGLEVPPFDVGEPEAEFAFQYPLDQDDYRPPEEKSWVPPVLRRDDAQPAPVPEEAWLRLATAKAALSHLGSSGSLAFTTIQVRPTIEFPRMPGVFLTPNFGWHFLGGPNSTDLPPRMHDYSIDFSVYYPAGNWLFNAGIMPGVFTDGKNTSSDALRIQGQLMAFYTVNPGRQLVLGFVYLDREDVPVLPTFGVLLQPRPDLKYELLFPKPRLAWRQSVQADWEQWVYATGELGGGSWAVRRTSGNNDIATYRDLRFILGVERLHASGHSLYVEGGYVFGRELEYRSKVGDRSFDDTAFIRVGGAF